MKQNHPFYADAIVIMPDHWHMIMTLPKGDINYPTRLSLIKSTFSREISLDETISQSRKNKRERGIWQRRYREHTILDLQDNEHHLNYIHFNPVKHGYVSKASDWKYSSIHRFINNGMLSENWAFNDDFTNVRFGE